MTTFVAEIAAVSPPLPGSARMFVFIEADTVAGAISQANALGVLRHDRKVMIDLYERRGSDLGPKLWSGLHRVPAARPQLKVV